MAFRFVLSHRWRQRTVVLSKKSEEIGENRYAQIFFGLRQARIGGERMSGRKRRALWTSFRSLSAHGGKVRGEKAANFYPSLQYKKVSRLVSGNPFPLIGSIFRIRSITLPRTQAWSGHHFLDWVKYGNSPNPLDNVSLLIGVVLCAHWTKKTLEAKPSTLSRRASGASAGTGHW